MNKIILIRAQKMMVSSDLTELNGLTTKRINEK